MLGLHGTLRKDRRNRLTKVTRSVDGERPVLLFVDDAIVLSCKCASPHVDGVGGVGSMVDGKASILRVVPSRERGEDAGHSECARFINGDDPRVRMRRTYKYAIHLATDVR